MTYLYTLITSFGCGCCLGAWLGVSAIGTVVGSVERDDEN